MAFVQIIEMQTTRWDEIEQLHEAWLSETEGIRTSASERVLRDRDRPNTFVIVVEFASYDEAMSNNELPATKHFAEAVGKLLDGPPTYRNCDLVRTDS